MVMDKYGNTTCLGPNKYSLEVLMLYSLLEWININYQLNYERATTNYRSYLLQIYAHNSYKIAVGQLYGTDFTIVH